MKLSQLRPCDHCGEKLHGVFSVLTAQPATLHPRAVGQVMGLMSMFGGDLALAEVMASEPVVRMHGTEVSPAFKTDLILCDRCMRTPIRIADLVEKRAEQFSRANGRQTDMPTSAQRPLPALTEVGGARDSLS
jgi:hypothetical protein